MPGIGGTGRLARRLVDHVEGHEIGGSRGVTRHQFFEGPGVPKTSRNSSAAIAIETSLGPSELLEVVTGFVTAESIFGSDPGVAILVEPPPVEAIRFAREAQRRLVTRAEAFDIAREAGIPLVGLGGTEDGVIGALCGAALRWEGNDGRFVGLPGIRDVAGPTTVADLVGRTAIAEVIDGDSGSLLGGEVIIDVGDWVRPRLHHGRPVLVARSVEGTWVNADARPE